MSFWKNRKLKKLLKSNATLEEFLEAGVCPDCKDYTLKHEQETNQEELEWYTWRNPWLMVTTITHYSCKRCGRKETTTDKKFYL